MPDTVLEAIIPKIFKSLKPGGLAGHYFPPPRKSVPVQCATYY